MVKKIYVVENEKQKIVEQLQSQGIKVLATNGRIQQVELDTATHNIQDVENLTGLKFEEKTNELKS